MKRPRLRISHRGNELAGSGKRTATGKHRASRPSSGTEELVLPSTLESLEKIDRVTLRVAKLAGLTGESVDSVAIAVIEAVTNAIVHGNRNSASKTVMIRYGWKPGSITVTVHDEGEGFDLSCVFDPTDPVRCMACSGRGIFIMRQVMDTVDFCMPKGEGTTVTMTKAGEAPRS